jgi:vancomycin resistance protein YoaR
MDIQKKKSKKQGSPLASQNSTVGAAKKKTAPKTTLREISPRLSAFFITLFSLWALWFVLSTVGLIYNIAFVGTTYPGLTISGRDVSNVTHDQLKKIVTEQASALAAKNWKFTYKDKEYQATSDQLALSFNIQETVDTAWQYGHTDSFLNNLYEQFSGMLHGVHQGVASTFSLDDFNYSIGTVLADVGVEPKNADLTVDEENIIHLVTEIPGQTVDTTLLRTEILQNITVGSRAPIPLVVYTTRPAITNSIARAGIPYISRLLESGLTFTYKTKSWDIAPKKIRTWVATRPAAILTGTAPTTGSQTVNVTAGTIDAATPSVPTGADIALYVDSKGVVTSQLANPTQEDILPALSSESIQILASQFTNTIASNITDRVSTLLRIGEGPGSAIQTSVPIVLIPVFDRVELNKTFDTISKGIDEGGQNVVLAVVDGKLTVKQPSKKGRGIDRDDAISKVLAAVQSNSERVIPLVVDEIEPEVTEANLARLGIKELIGEGVSDFSGSTKSRIHNIQTAVARFQGALIKPGEEFSFTHTLGPVEAYTGYLPELVIVGTKIEPQYGGGVCQVSTTLFRAAVYSGLQITQRKNHSFVVHYYGTPGMDATVYYPNPDLRFVNNTPAYILVQAHFDGHKLYFDLYGTSDGRSVKTEGPYIYDRGAGGALKASWTQIVMNGGKEVSRKVFNSVYKSISGFTRTGFQN